MAEYVGSGATPKGSLLEAQLQLVKANRAAIYATLCRVASSGRSVSDAVVIVADTSDELGLELADAARALSRLSIREVTTQVKDRDEPATTIVALALEDAKTLFGVKHSSITGGLDQVPAQGCVRVVAIAAGRTTLVHTDVRASATIAEG